MSGAGGRRSPAGGDRGYPRTNSGKQYRRRFSTKKAAEEFEFEMRKREERRRNGLPEVKGPVTYREFVNKFLAQYTAQSKGWLEGMLAHSLTRFGAVQIHQIRPEDVASWVVQLPQSAKTRQHILGALRQVLQRAVDWDYLSRNPAGSQFVQKPKTARTDIRPFESWTEVEKVAQAAEKVSPARGKWRALIVFACATGLRPEEWIGLSWADIDFSKRTCRVSKVVVRGELRTDRGKTDAAFRTIQLPARATNALQALPRPIKADTLIIPAPQGGFVSLDNWRKRVWEKALAKAEVDYRPLYQMRHTFATLGLAAGADIYWVSKQLGHTNISTTLRHYARFVKSVDDRNLKLLDAFSA
jgi:integrase